MNIPNSTAGQAARAPTSGALTMSRATVTLHMTFALVVQIVLCSTAVVSAVVFRHSANTALITPLCLAVTAAFAWSFWSWWRITGSFVDPYLMFLTSLFLFSAGQAPLEILGLNDQGLLKGKFDDETLIATLLIVGIGLTVTHLGALIAVRVSAKVVHRPRVVASSQALRAIGWILFVVSAIPSALLLLDSVRQVAAGGYMSLYQREASVGIAAGPQVLAMFLVPAAMFLLAGAEGRRLEKITAATVICAYMLIQLFLGYRSVAFMSGCAFAWLWDRLEWKFKLRWVVAGMLVALVASAVSGDTRTRSGVERYSIRTFVDSYASLENPIVSTVSEMGNSMAAVAYTYVLVPSSRRFDNGMSYAYASLTILPNLFWAIHPAIAHGTAQDWLIWTVDARGASKQGGLGYSCIAEAYLNFGWTGVVLIMTLVGFGVGKLGLAGREVDRGHLALVAAFTAFVLKFPRDESEALVRAFAWYSLVPYALALLVSRMGASKRAVGSMMPPQVVSLGATGSGTVRQSRSS